MDHRAKLSRLEHSLTRLDSVLVAFSAGVDSTFLAAVAQRSLGDRAMAVTAVSPFVPASELEDARALARTIRIRHRIVRFHPPRACWKNTARRCYYCKRSLFVMLTRVARRYGLKHVAEGSNLDDVNDLRPGAAALKELRIISPLRDARFTKQDIRRASRALRLPTWSKEPSPCLATRIPYGQVITPAALSVIEAAEAYIRKLGARNVRVRHCGTTARIEVADEDIPLLTEKRRAVVRTLRSLGFVYVTIDLAGFRSGSMNEVLAWTRKK